MVFWSLNSSLLVSLMIIIEYSFLYSLNYALNLQGLFTACFKFVLLNIFLSSTTNPCNPLVTAFYFWFSQLFLILHIKWYIVFVFLCLNYLTFICSFHPCCCKQQDALLLHGWIILQCVCVCVCDIFFPIYWWILRYFQVFGYWK